MTEMRRRLFGPGPTNVSDEVLAALARPTIGHLDPAFLTIMDRVSARLRYAFRTDNALTFCLSAPGSVGMEASLVNLLEPGDKAVVCINGVFGGRMRDIASRAGADVVTLEAEWGEPVDPDSLDATLAEHEDATLVAFVHAETSTGVRSDAAALARVAKRHGCLVVADCVTSLAGIDVDVDGWGIDVAYSGSQKCLSCVPGLSPITFSGAALERIRSRSVKVQSWFCDVSQLKDYYETGSGSRAYHHTAPVNSLVALDAALGRVESETLETRWSRHAAAAAALSARLEAVGLNPLVAAEARLAPLTLVRIPDGVDDAAVRQYLLEHRSTEIGAGLGKFAGRAWRIGLMGDNATVENAESIVAALVDAIDAVS